MTLVETKDISRFDAVSDLLRKGDDLPLLSGVVDGSPTVMRILNATTGWRRYWWDRRTDRWELQMGLHCPRCGYARSAYGHCAMECR